MYLCSRYQIKNKKIMKSLKKTFSYLFMLTALVTSFASCSSDDDEPEIKAADLAAGTYTGWAKGDCNYFSDYLGDDYTASATLTANTDGTATLAFTSTTWNDLTLSSVTVSQSGDCYAIAGSGKYAMSGMSGTTSEYDCEMSGTISSDKQTFNIKISVPGVMGGLTITLQNGEPTAAIKLAGSYSGTSTMVMKYAPDGIGYAGQTMTLTANEDGTINLSYKFVTTGDDGTETEMGNITLNNIELTESESGYTFTASGATFKMGMSGTLSEYPCDVTGTISADKKTYSVAYSIPGVMGGTTVTFHND